MRRALPASSARLSTNTDRPVYAKGAVAQPGKPDLLTFNWINNIFNENSFKAAMNWTMLSVGIESF
jgi:hypothetical protein